MYEWYNSICILLLWLIVVSHIKIHITFECDQFYWRLHTIFCLRSLLVRPGNYDTCTSPMHAYLYLVTMCLTLSPSNHEKHLKVYRTIKPDGVLHSKYNYIVYKYVNVSNLLTN